MASRGVNFRFVATNAASRAMRQIRDDLGKVQRSMNNARKAGGSWNAGLNANRRAVQQFGFQMTDFAVQVSGGQSAMLAFTQQGGQMLQFFGPAGAIAAAFLAVFGSLAIAFTRSGKALSDLFPLTGVLKKQFSAIGDSVLIVKEALLDFTNVVVNNLDVILIAASVLAVFFASRWVASFVAAKIAVYGMTTSLAAMTRHMRLYGAGATMAAVATRGFAGATMAAVGALRVMKKILITTGVGALVIGLGYAIERFVAMSRVVGGFGNLFRLMGDVIKETMTGWMQHLVAFDLEVRAVQDDIRDSFYKWVHHVGNLFKGLFAGISAMWGKLPAVFGEIMFNLGQIVARGVGSLVDMITKPFNVLIEQLNRIPGVSIPVMNSVVNAVNSVVSPFGDAGADAGRAFTDAMNKEMSEFVPFGNASLFRERAAQIRDAANGATPALDRLVEVWNSARDEQVDVRDWFGGSGVADETIENVSGLTKELNDAEQAAKSMTDSLAGVFHGVGSQITKVLVGVGTMQEKVVGVFNTIMNRVGALGEKLIDMALDQLITQLFGNLISVFGGGSMSGFNFSSIFSPRGFATGGYTGHGAVSAPAGIVHGREYVMNAAATSRIGVPALDAMNSGMAVSGDNDNGGGLNININIDARGAQQGVGAEISTRLDEFARNELPDHVQRINNDPYARG